MMGELEKFAARLVVQLLQDPRVTKAIVKAFEYRSRARAMIDEAGSKLDETLTRLVNNDIAGTNHCTGAPEDDGRDLGEAVRDSRKPTER